MEKAQFRIVSLAEINSCSCKRLDPQHYLPIHRTWECKHKTKLRTKKAIVNTWLNGELGSDQFLLSCQTTTQHNPIKKEEVEEAV